MNICLSCMSKLVGLYYSLRIKLCKCNIYIFLWIKGCSIICVSNVCDDSGVCICGCKIGFVGFRCEILCYVKCKYVLYLNYFLLIYLFKNFE